MESDQNGEFVLVYNGRNSPGITHYNATGLSTGNSYQFKVASLNYNGAGTFSTTLKVYSCLPPVDMLPPRFMSSTKTSISLDWTMPGNTNGCPLTKFILYMNDGIGGLITTKVGEFEP